jgi:hypothetical protein
VLQFLVIIAILRNREIALRTATDGKFGGHHRALTALHVTLAMFTFIFGTAAEAYGMDTSAKFAEINIAGFRSITPTLSGVYPFVNLHGEYQHRLNVCQQLSYVFNTFAILMVIDVAVTTALLWQAWKKTGMSDKVTCFSYSRTPHILTLTRSQT